MKQCICCGIDSIQQHNLRQKVLASPEFTEVPLGAHVKCANCSRVICQGCIIGLNIAIDGNASVPHDVKINDTSAALLRQMEMYLHDGHTVAEVPFGTCCIFGSSIPSDTKPSIYKTPKPKWQYEENDDGDYTNLSRADSILKLRRRITKIKADNIPSTNLLLLYHDGTANYNCHGKLQCIPPKKHLSDM